MADNLLQAAQLETVIDRLPQGLDTTLVNVELNYQAANDNESPLREPWFVIHD